RISVGKAPGRADMTQADINALLIERGKAGQRVERLKGGDPFVFGRGGEEAEFLRERGVPFRIVPGITSAIAAPAYAGIPVTHRDAASSFAVITGHERGDERESGTRDAGNAEMRRDWSKIAHAADTLVFLMGVESLGENAQKLIENGRAADTPVALVQWGTWTRQRVVTGTLADIAEIARAAKITAPAVTVVGDVVRYREAIRWFDTGALFGKRVLVTRSREQASELSDKLRTVGADPIEFPMIRITEPADGYAGLDAALPGIGGYDWIVFTSANAVKQTFDRLNLLLLDARAFGTTQVAAIGSVTADALRERGIVADFAPDEFVAEAVLAQFPEPVSGKRILLPRAQDARDVLPDGLRERGATVEIVTAYQTVIETEGAMQIHEMMDAGELDIITFASSSTVRNFVEAMGGSPVPDAVMLAAIGPVTADTCRELLRPPDCIATEYTMDGLIAAIETTLAAKGAAL
ncbi:MAG: uroporphyrinogen-III C-methyltransferase, partial [Armatimonadetes bacterium]|nr:uroporphyrinogen-III C-methyltransferase [Armatimonadota bacterium]